MQMIMGTSTIMISCDNKPVGAFFMTSCEGVYGVRCLCCQL